MNATEIKEMQKEYQEEIGDLKGMMALLVASLKLSQARIQTANAMFADREWNLGCSQDLKSIQEFIAQAEDMLKGGE